MKKRILIICGFILVALGTIGIIVPLLPTTPFLLLAAYCFTKSSDRFYNWLMNNKMYGKHLHIYIQKKGVPISVKIFTIILLWVGIGSSAIFFVDLTLVKILLLFIAAGVTIHVLMIRTSAR